jgi:hypothetical protein
VSGGRLRQARRAYREAVAAREDAEDDLRRAEADVEAACHGWDEWDARCAVQTAIERIDEARQREEEARRECERRSA